MSDAHSIDHHTAEHDLDPHGVGHHEHVILSWQLLTGILLALLCLTALTVFTAQADLEAAQAFRRKVRDAAAGHGRDPDGVKVMPGLSVYVGRTREEAQEKFDALHDMVDVADAVHGLGLLLGGAVVVEQIFTIPGLGQLAVVAVIDRDIPLIQGIVVMSTLAVVVANLVVDLVQMWLNPKLRAA